MLYLYKDFNEKAMKLNTLIVDDEEFARKNLRMLVEEYCPELNVVGEASGKKSAKEILASGKVDVVFLDIRMPSGSEGFELLEEINNQNFRVVFVTAFKDYAIRAFNASAVYYLLKPIDIDELKLAVQKLVESQNSFEEQPENFGAYFDSLRDLSDRLLHQKKSNRIAISHTKGLKIVEDDSISHLEASGNCTTIYFKDGSRYLDTRTLKIYENLLDESKFSRVHKSHILNLDLLKEYVNEDGHFAVLDSEKGDIRIPIARNRVSEFVKMLKER